MDKLVEMATRVLRTGVAETMNEANRREVLDTYRRDVQQPLEEMRREQAVALDAQRFIACR